MLVSPTPRNFRDERGQMLAILALALLMIVGFAALAIDLGNIGQSKRHTQNAVDLAALSGAQELGTDQCTNCTGSGNASGDLPAIVSDVETYLTKNYSGADAPGWNSCSGVTLSGSYQAVSWMAYPTDFNGNAQNCIDFGTTSGSTQTNVIRVQLPPQFIRYFLGQVVGQGAGVNVASVSYASVQTAKSFFGLPIGVGTDSVGQGYTCIKGGSGNGSCPNGLPPPAAGIVINPRYRVFANASDNGGGNNDAVEVDLALGIDHQLQAYDATASVHYCDAKDTPATNACPPADTNNSASSSYWDLASEIYLASGNTNTTVQNGIACGDSSVDPSEITSLQARLAHNANDTSADTTVANPGDSPQSPTIAASLFCKTPLDANIDGRQISCYLTTKCGQTPTSSGQALYDKGWGSTSSCGNTTPDPSTVNVQDPAWNAGVSCLAAQLVADSSTAWSEAQAGTAPQLDFPQSIINSPRFALVPVVPASCTKMCPIVADPPVAPYGFAAAYLDAGQLTGGGGGSSKDFSLQAYLFSPLLVEGGPFIGGGAGTGKYTGGPFVVNLCSLTASGGTGNC